MNTGLPDLSKEQWDFLAVLHVLEEPVSLEIAGELSPILPAPFLDLLGRNQTSAMIKEVESNKFCISSELSPAAINELKMMHSPNRLSILLDRIYEMNIIGQISPKVVAKLLVQTGRSRDIAELEIDQARKALNEGDQHLAMQHLWNVVKQLYDISDNPEQNELFISATLKLSDLCFALGKGFMDLPRFLKKARTLARHLGDRRSHSLINLNLSIFLHIARQHDQSIKALSAGLKEVEELGDEDILRRSAAFLGLNFFLQGMFKEAEPHLERAVLDYDYFGVESMTIGPLPMPFLLGYCVANLGYFHDAIGGLERSRRLAKARAQDALATNIRAVLGAVLQMIHKKKAAAFHLEIARKEAIQTHNSFALSIADGSLTYQYFLEGQIDKARKRLDQDISIGETEEFLRLYTAPSILEMVFEIEKSSPPHPRLNFKDEISWIMKAPNIHTKGAAFRLLAREAMGRGGQTTQIRSFLADSEKYLNLSGDPIQLAKTWLEMARLELREENKSKARLLVRKAYDNLSAYNDMFFPEDLKFLLKKEDKALKIKNNYQDFLYRLMKIFESQSYSENVDQILTQTLKYACRLFSAERGGIIRFDASSDFQQPTLLAGYNMTSYDVTDVDFDPSLRIIRKVVKTRLPIVEQMDTANRSLDSYPVREVFCLPMMKGRNIQGVFYFDNIYLENNFDLLDDTLMEQMGKFMNDHIERVIDYNRLKKETSIWTSAQSFQIEQLEREEMVFQSQVMIQLISQVEQIAATDTTILIQGETGVGKELLAQKIHNMSQRKSGPFEVVDLTSIPETLLESELFGYEKGAFTGADNQKRGRIELARNGTLLLDEIGEIPLSFQVKLLRVLQEKTFIRVGGTRTLTADFRLIAATNRNLEVDVSSGHFRQDLFYRLNMMPIVIPPLREREDDIVMLARHFLSQYALKHNKENLSLSPDDMAVLTSCPWPGNVRELKNVIERTVLLSKNERLDFSPLKTGAFPDFSISRDKVSFSAKSESQIFADMPTLEELERRYIRYVLDKTDGKIGGSGGAGDVLGIKRTTLYSRMKKLGFGNNK